MTTVKEAVAARFQELMKERGIKTNELANRSGITPSSVYSMLDPRRKEVSVNLVKKLCDGLDITLGEFFAAPVFDDLEQEIQSVFCFLCYGSQGFRQQPLFIGRAPLFIASGHNTPIAALCFLNMPYNF